MCKISFFDICIAWSDHNNLLPFTRLISFGQKINSSLFFIIRMTEDNEFLTRIIDIYQGIFHDNTHHGFEWNWNWIPPLTLKRILNQSCFSSCNTPAKLSKIRHGQFLCTLGVFPMTVYCLWACMNCTICTIRMRSSLNVRQIKIFELLSYSK